MFLPNLPFPVPLENGNWKIALQLDPAAAEVWAALTPFHRQKRSNMTNEAGMYFRINKKMGRCSLFPFAL
jgi:hypothetical protein